MGAATRDHGQGRSHAHGDDTGCLFPASHGRLAQRSLTHRAACRLADLVGSRLPGRVQCLARSCYCLFRVVRCQVLRSITSANALGPQREETEGAIEPADGRVQRIDLPPASIFACCKSPDVGPFHLCSCSMYGVLVSVMPRCTRCKTANLSGCWPGAMASSGLAGPGTH